MLRQTQQLTTGATGASLSAVHTLGQIPNVVIITGRNADAFGTFLAALDAAHVTITNSINSVGVVDVTTIFWQGRLY